MNADGEWLFVEGSAQVLSMPEAMDPLVDCYKRFPDEETPTGTTTGRGWSANDAC